ncbi:MAG: hypothetical protein HY898_26320 [Deltaproteobacteria bacterium]|nr:hypothetical protein [Deltaproteobacteria bacterium]
MKNTTWIWIGCVVALLCSASGCKKAEEEPADAAPSATASTPPAPDPTPTASASEAPKPPPPPVTNVGGDISGCCAALKADASKLPTKDKGPYQSAAAVCDGLAGKVKSGAINAADAKRTVRAQLQRATSIPGACR